jgi:hypothetical protein
MTYQAALSEARQPVTPNLAPGADYADDKRVFQGIPGIERTPAGRLWATWYSGGQGESSLNYIVLVTSGDDGATWSGPVLVIDPPGHVRACDPNVWLDPCGRLWLFWMQAHTLHDGQWGVWAITTDEPDEPRPRWSGPRRLCDGIMLNKPTILSSGEWLFPVAFPVSRMMGNEKRMLPLFLRRDLLGLMTEDELRAIDARHGAAVYVSTDQGQTFAYRGRAVPEQDVASHNEHMIIERRDGSLWMLLRTKYGIGQSESRDGGATWSPVVESGLPHTTSRFFIRRLRSGNLLLVKHDAVAGPDGKPVYRRTNLTAQLSDDDGRTWRGRLCIEPRGCTYPDGTQGSDGTIYIIYDHERRGAKQMVMAAFTEQDILAGGFHSPQARQAVLINQATGVITPADDWARSKGKDEEDLIFTGI